MRVVAFKLTDGSYKHFDTVDAFLSLHTFVKEVKDADVEVIIFGEVDSKGKVIWEKNFTGGELVNIAFSKRFKEQ